MKTFIMLRKIAGPVENFVTVDAFMEAFMRNEISSVGGDNLTLLARVAFALAPFFRYRAEHVRIHILLRLYQIIVCLSFTETRLLKLLNQRTLRVCSCAVFTRQY